MSFPQLPSRLRLVFRITVISAAMGAAYSQIYVAQNHDPFFAAYGMMRGSLVGMVIGGLLSSFEVFFMWGPAGAPLRHAPFAVHVAVKTLIYLIVILFGLSLGGWALPSPGERGIEGADVLFSLAASFVFVFMLDVNRLLGQNVLLNFVTGRYHKPRLEDRIFLFIDMEGSTGLAERLGPLAFHRLLNRFVTDLTEPIVAAGGEIYSYVGDEADRDLEARAGNRSRPAAWRPVSTLSTSSRERRPNTGANSAPPSISAPGSIAVPWSPARWGR